jgi:hypothetical protein
MGKGGNEKGISSEMPFSFLQRQTDGRPADRSESISRWHHMRAASTLSRRSVSLETCNNISFLR